LAKKFEEEIFLVKKLQENEKKEKAIETLGNDKTKLASEQQNLKKELAELQEKYNREYQIRIAQEALFGQLSETLQSQKESLKALEEARVKLTEELASANQDYVQHLKEVANVSKSSSMPIASISPATVTSQISAPAAKPTPTSELGTKMANQGLQRAHIVGKGDTLSGISMQYYGTSKRWNEIYEANKEIIPNKNSIKAGTKLVIP